MRELGSPVVPCRAFSLAGSFASRAGLTPDATLPQGKVEPPKRRDADRDHGAYARRVMPARVSPPQQKEGFFHAREASLSAERSPGPEGRLPPDLPRHDHHDHAAL